MLIHSHKMALLTTTKTSQPKKHNSILEEALYFSLLQNYQTGSGCYSAFFIWVKGNSLTLWGIKWSQDEHDHSALPRTTVKHGWNCTTNPACLHVLQRDNFTSCPSEGQLHFPLTFTFTAFSSTSISAPNFLFRKVFTLKQVTTCSVLIIRIQWAH